MKVKTLINSMRLRTLPLSLAGVVCGGVMGYAHPACRPGTHIFLVLTAVMLQILTNLSNELGDHLSGVDSESREGPNYSMADGGLTVKQMWRAINTFVVLCAVSGLIMLLLSFPLASIGFWVFILMGAAAIWAATHYTLGKKPYGYIGLGDLFVFLFFGLASVLGSHYVIAADYSIRTVDSSVSDVTTELRGNILPEPAIADITVSDDYTTVFAGVHKSADALLGRLMVRHPCKTIQLFTAVLIGHMPCYPVHTAVFISVHYIGIGRIAPEDKTGRICLSEVTVYLVDNIPRVKAFFGEDDTVKPVHTYERVYILKARNIRIIAIFTQAVV